MATTVTGLQVLDHLFAKRAIGIKIANGEIGSIAATALTSVYHFRNPNLGDTDLINVGAGLWRPSNATGIADDWRPVSTLAESTGAVTVDTWADTTLGAEDVYMLLYRIHPSWVREAMNLALRDVYFQNEDPVSLAKDAGFQSSATSDWSVTDSTFAKISTANSFNVFPSYIRSGHVLNAGYITQNIPVTRGEEMYVAWLVRAESGTASLVLQDTTNSVELGTARTTTEENWQYLERREPMGSTTETLQPRLTVTSSPNEFYTNGLWMYPTNAYQLPLATTWDTAFKKPVLSYLEFGQATAEGVYDARSARKKEVPRQDYDFLDARAGANPNAIQFHNNKWLRCPLLIQGRRAHSDVDGPFTRTLTETTSADLDLFEAAVARRLFSDERVRLVDRTERLARAEGEFRSLSSQFSIQGPAESPVRAAFMGLRS